MQNAECKIIEDTSKNKVLKFSGRMQADDNHLLDPVTRICRCTENYQLSILNCKTLSLLTGSWVLPW
jgi:hypothetical protein